MTKPVARKLRCAIYTRKSTEEGLDMEFNSLDAQREACEAYIVSQKAEGWPRAEKERIVAAAMVLGALGAVTVAARYLGRLRAP